MGFDLFAPFTTSAQQAAAGSQIAGINAGYNQLSQLYGQGQQQLQQNYTAGLQPLQQTYGTAQQGTQQLGNLLGLNGAAGNQSAQQTLTNMPGYQFAQQQGAAQTNAGLAATGQLASGNQQLALQKQGQGLASQNYNQYVSQLQPYLGAQQNTASGIGNLYSGLGNQLNASSMGQGNAAYGAQTSIGNANANAQLAALNAGANQFGLLTGGLSGFLGLQSDKRVKEDIEPVGKLYDGQKLYRFRYKGEPRHQLGLIAQEVEKRNIPDAVREIGGIKQVNYRLATDLAAGLKHFAGKSEKTRGLRYAEPLQKKAAA